MAERSLPSMKLFDLTGQRALVTGAGSGIGLAYASALAGAGAEVVLNGRNVEKLEGAAETLRSAGGTVSIQAFDVTDEVAVNENIAEIERDKGQIDILFNNAGVNLRGPMVDMEYDTFRQVLDTNMNSVFLVTRAVGKGMVARNRGKVVCTCSVLSKIGRAGIVPYGASKAAVAMMIKCLCDEWAGNNIQINGIGPGYFQTELTGALSSNTEFNDWLTARTPAGRWGELDELMGPAVFLASEASNFVNGHILMVDGGLTVVT